MGNKEFDAVAMVRLIRDEMYEETKDLSREKLIAFYRRRGAAGRETPARAQQVTVGEEALTVDLVDGRTLIVPLIWFPRLWHGTATERDNVELVGDGIFIHWPDLDEDLSVAGLLSGNRSEESSQSLKKWLEARSAQPNPRTGDAVRRAPD